MNVLVWHVHGSWMTSFVRGPHVYYVPVVADRGPEGRGRAETWDWPPNVIEVDLATSVQTPYDVVVLQSPRELAEYAPRWVGSRQIGHDLPAIYVEHDAPPGSIDDMRHHVADRADIALVHVTNFNALFWDSGTTDVRVIEHAVVDPGFRYTGELDRTAVVINEAARRGRTTGTDLLERFGRVAPIDLFGMGAAAFGGIENLPQERLHVELARRRAYLHPNRWTSLGLSLLEAMYLGMPVVALATTEAHEAVPAGVGFCSTSVAHLIDALRRLHGDPAEAREYGLRARAHALERYGMPRFISQWNDVFREVCA